MLYSICGQAGHRKNNCPSKKPVNDENEEMRRVEAGNPPRSEAKNKSKKIPSDETVKKKRLKELKRQTLQTRRK